MVSEPEVHALSNYVELDANFLHVMTILSAFHKSSFTHQFFVAPFTAPTSSSNGKISGTGPTGVIPKGLICA